MSKLQRYPVATFVLTLMCATAILVAAGLAESPSRDIPPTGLAPLAAAPVVR